MINVNDLVERFIRTSIRISLFSILSRNYLIAISFSFFFFVPNEDIFLLHHHNRTHMSEYNKKKGTSDADNKNGITKVSTCQSHENINE